VSAGVDGDGAALIIRAAHWGLVNPSPGVFDWTGFRDLALFRMLLVSYSGVFEDWHLGSTVDIAQEVGLWVIVRPGPYINAETTAGGIPGWVTTLEGTLRTNTTDYREAWEPYIRQVCRITRPYQISKGGPVILMQVENELLQAYGKSRLEVRPTGDW
jgi:beta-galactosidase GanA